MSTKSDKFTWQLFTIVVLIHVAAYVIFVNQSWLQTTITKEREAHYEVLGEKRAEFAEIRATNLFNVWFVNSGVMARSFEIFIPKADPSAPPESSNSTSAMVFRWMEERIRALWTLVYQVMLRFSNASLWWPFLVLAISPFVVDALAARRIKAHTFGITSPHLQGVATRLIPLLILGYFLLMFAPIVIHPLWVPVLIVVTSAATWLGVTQFVKRG